MIHITLDKTESLFVHDTEKAIVAREIYLDRENKTVRVITSCKDITYPTDNIWAMRESDSYIAHSPICEFDFLDEF